MCTRSECFLVEVGYGFKINGKKGFNRGNYIPYQTVSNFIKQRNSYSVFSSAYRYDSTDIDQSNLYGDLYLDFDDINNFEHVRKDALTALSYLKIVYHINEDQVKLYYSGNKGVHIIVPAIIYGLEPTHHLNGIYKVIAQSIKTFTPFKTLDLQIYDNKRMFRLPNTIHEKSNLYKIQLLPNELRELSEQSIKELAQKPRQISSCPVLEVNHIAQQQFQKSIEEYYIFDKEARKDKHYKKKLTFIPPCIQYILENGAVEGQRNITIACLASFYKNYGKSLNETIDTVSEWNSKNIKPTNELEMKKTIKSIFNSNKDYGCTTLKLISQCSEYQCKLKKKEGVKKNVT